MQKLGMILAVILVFGALAFWIRTFVPLPTVHVAIPTIASLVGTSTSAASLTASAAAAVPSVTDGDYVDLTGTILIDRSDGTAVPFLQYIDSNNKVATKQLVYANSRACAANAGDLPCVDRNPNDAYPQYATGTRVRVRGIHTADRVLVYQIDPV